MLKIKNQSFEINKKPILKDISLEVSQGKVIGIVGKNGSGKSTLLKALAGLLVSFEGNIIREKDMKIGVFLDYLGLEPMFSGYKNLKLISLFNSPEALDFSTLINFFVPSDFLSKKYKNMSLGMQHKTKLITAFMNEPDLILLDEPTNALDATGVLQPGNLIEASRRRGAAIFIVSHQINEIQNYCDVVYFMKNGSIISEYNKNDFNGNNLIVEFNKVVNE